MAGINRNNGRFLALSGGVGGAKLALGLSRVLEPSQLTVIANTGDDFEHLGLYISPDLDTLLYTLAGINNPDLGWGRADETWNFMEAARQLGMDTWFQLGDRDLAVHLYRTDRQRRKATLSAITAELCARFGVYTEIVPMSDEPVRTLLTTDLGELSFQDYFVRHRCTPRVSDIHYPGAEIAAPSPLFAKRLSERTLRAVIVCPSNPFLSIRPILALPGIRSTLESIHCPVIVVSPLVRNRALKGPTTRLMKNLGLAVSVPALAGLYAGIADGIVIDAQDRDVVREIEKTGMAVHTANIVMNSLRDRINLAGEVIGFAGRLQAGKLR